MSDGKLSETKQDSIEDAYPQIVFGQWEHGEGGLHPRTVLTVTSRQFPELTQHAYIDIAYERAMSMKWKPDLDELKRDCAERLARRIDQHLAVVGAAGGNEDE